MDGGKYGLHRIVGYGRMAKGEFAQSKTAFGLLDYTEGHLARFPLWLSQYFERIASKRINPMKTLTTWISDIYTRHGWLAAIIVLAVIVALVVGVCLALGIDGGDMARWLGAL